MVMTVSFAKMESARRTVDVTADTIISSVAPPPHDRTVARAFSTSRELHKSVTEVQECRRRVGCQLSARARTSTAFDTEPTR
jgi:hypothetical protein